LHLPCPPLSLGGVRRDSRSHAAPIWEYVSGYAPDIRGNADLAFLRAFTDDSAAQEGDRRLFLAGYLHRADAWAAFSDHWDAELKAWPAIEYFKASEAHHLSGQFHYKKGWDEAKRDAKIGNLVEIIKAFQPFSFEFSVNRQIFEDELRPVSPYGLGKPHFTMCFAVVAGIASSMAREGINTPIEFIFDEQDGVDADMLLLFPQMKKSLSVEAQNLVDGLPIFKNDRDKRYMPLQAADLLAWHLRREHETGTKLSRTGDLLNKASHLIQETPDEVLRMWADHHSRQPGISLVQSKGRWRNFKKEIQSLQDAGIDPSKIKGPGIYYPDNMPMLARTIDIVKRLFRRHGA
jgi:hypothetical protein